MYLRFVFVCVLLPAGICQAQDTDQRPQVPERRLSFGVTAGANVSRFEESVRFENWPNQPGLEAGVFATYPFRPGHELYASIRYANRPYAGDWSSARLTPIATQFGNAKRLEVEARVQIKPVKRGMPDSAWRVSLFAGVGAGLVIGSEVPTAWYAPAYTVLELEQGVEPLRETLPASLVRGWFSPRTGTVSPYWTLGTRLRVYDSPAFLEAGAQADVWSSTEGFNGRYRFMALFLRLNTFL